MFLEETALHLYHERCPFQRVGKVDTLLPSPKELTTAVMRTC
jgi:hypothetical protein